jgi:hypothetical protein
MMKNWNWNSEMYLELELVCQDEGIVRIGGKRELFLAQVLVRQHEELELERNANCIPLAGASASA